MPTSAPRLVIHNSISIGEEGYLYTSYPFSTRGQGSSGSDYDYCARSMCIITIVVEEDGGE
jgi:hypothetical protein